MSDRLTPFNVVKGTEASIKSCRPIKGYLWFATDTRKIYYSDGVDFISMGGNSSVFYGTLTWGKDDQPDSDQVEFDFTPNDIEGNAIPNINDLILNSDGCFYRVTQITSGIIKTIKLTIAGSGSGGSGGGGGVTPTSSIITISAPVSTKYFLETEENPMFSFTVHSTLETGNKITKIVYTIGTQTFTDDEPHAFGTINLDLKNYFNNITENGTTLSFRVEDMYGAIKSSSTYSLKKVRLYLTADTTNDTEILQAEEKRLQYRAIPRGSNSISNVVMTYQIFIEGSNTPLQTLTQDIPSINGNVVMQNLHFDQIDTIGNGLGAYSLKVYCSGTAGGQTIMSNILTHSVISYGEDPVLIAYLPTERLQQYDNIDIFYEIAKSTIDNKKARITFTIMDNGNETVTIHEVDYNSIYKFNLYFETTGYKSLKIQDEFNNTQTFNNIYVTAYNGSVQVIDTSDIDLKLNLTARGRSNNELAASRAIWTDVTHNKNAILSDFIWGNINGWLTDNNGVNMLHLSSGANMIITDYQPFGLDSNGQEGMVTGKTIELDFCITDVTDYSAPLITCLSYNDDESIRCGFQITGEAATFNTANIKATEGSIIDDDEHQEYNTQIQGLTAKFTEGERIHLTWVIQKKSETHPMIKTYINGIVSGISEYTGSSDSIAQNSTTGSEPALIKIGSNTGAVDIYNIRVFNKDLTDRQVLENYIATLPTTEEKATSYANNIGLLDSYGIISVNNIESGNYNITLPYIKFTGGGQCRKDDDGYWLTEADGYNHLPRAKKDFRLINHFDFVYPTDTTRNVDLVSEVGTNGLVNGVVMYGQGTSSMEYPVKNLRIKFKMKKNGKKVKFQVHPNDYPVDILTLKADYMESSSSHNTGTSNLIFDALENLNFHTPGQEYWNDQNPNYKTLTAIRGYPIICFFRPDENSDFEYIGRYNLNMDKSSEEAFGFLPAPEELPEIYTEDDLKFGWVVNDGTNSIKDPSEYPYVNGIHCYEFLNNASNLDNFIVGTSGMTFEELFYQDVIVDGENTKNWLTSFESRYPEDDLDVKAFYNMCAWVNSTNPDEATGLELDSAITYNGITYEYDTADYRLAKFTYEFEQHFNKNFVLFYYVLTHVLLMIDSRAKNMMIATWDNQHWYPIFYDMDTMLGLNNYGYNKFDYNVEDDEAKYPNVYNGQNSVLWNNLKKCFQSDIRSMYQEMQKNGGLTYTNLIRNYNEVQADMWNEIMYNYDAQYKYINPYSNGYYDGLSGQQVDAGTKNYLYAAQGSRSMHRRYWLSNRIQYFNGMYLSSAYKEDRFMMRLYTPNVGDAAYTVVDDITAENFVPNTYYIRTGNEGSYVYVLASSFEAGEVYYIQENNRLITSLAAVPANNDFKLTPLHNQYLSVAFGGDNGDTVGPIYAEANTPTLISTPGTARYNDTETYVYGASQIKDLGDLSSQYLGNIQFPSNTKLERLVLGNKKNGYYNPNFSAFSIGSAAPQLKYLDISNTQLRGAIDLEKCQNIEKIFACGSRITSVSLPGYGVLNELRLPDTVTNLVLNNQTKLINENFTWGSYDSNTETYTNSINAKISTLSIEGMPQFDSYSLLKQHANTISYYCLRDVNWIIPTSDIISTSDNLYGIQALETIINRNATPYGTANGSIARAITGTVTFLGEISADKLLDVYTHYSKIYPDLVITFDENSVKYVNLYDGNENLYWSKPIAVGEEITIDFFNSSSYGAYSIPRKQSTQQYKFEFTGFWLLNNEGEPILGDSDNNYVPGIGQIVSDNLNYYAKFSEEIQIYNFIFHINNQIVETSAEFGEPIINIVPKLIPYSSQNPQLTETSRQIYPFLGYSESSATASDNLFDFSTGVVNTTREFYAVFDDELVDITSSKNVFYPAWDIQEVNNYNYNDGFAKDNRNLIISNANDSYNFVNGYSVTLKDDWVYPKGVTIPSVTENGQPIKIFARVPVNANWSQICPDGLRIYCAENSQLTVIESECFHGVSQLIYFDFPSSLRQILNSAFTSTNLTNHVLGSENTTYIGNLAFNQGLNLLNNETIYIPNSINIMDTMAVSYSGKLHNWNLVIGANQGNYSQLELFKHSSINSRNIFGQNSGHMPNNVTFYTKKYSSFDDIVQGDNLSLSVKEHLFNMDVASTEIQNWYLVTN